MRDPRVPVNFTIPYSKLTAFDTRLADHFDSRTAAIETLIDLYLSGAIDVRPAKAMQPPVGASP